MKYPIVWLIVFVLLSGCSSDQRVSRYVPKGEMIETKRYVVGIHPYFNSKKMFEVYEPIIRRLELIEVGTLWELETSIDYAEYERKLYERRFHFSLPNPYQTIQALSRGYRVVAKMKPDSVFRGIFVARKSSGLKSIEQLKGKALSFPAPTALAATMMPLLFLHEQGLDIHRDIEQRFVGSQYSSILNAYSGDTIAGATWPPPWEAWCREHPQKAQEMEVVWQTQPLVNNGFIVRDDVDQAVAERVAQALVGLDAVAEGRALLEAAGFEGFERADNATYAPVWAFMRHYEELSPP